MLRGVILSFRFDFHVIEAHRGLNHIIVVRGILLLDWVSEYLHGVLDDTRFNDGNEEFIQSSFA
jgi:hypothetical protein